MVEEVEKPLGVVEEKDRVQPGAAGRPAPRVPVVIPEPPSSALPPPARWARPGFVCAVCAGRPRPERGGGGGVAGGGLTRPLPTARDLYLKFLNGPVTNGRGRLARSPLPAPTLSPGRLRPGRSPRPPGFSLNPSSRETARPSDTGPVSAASAAPPAGSHRVPGTLRKTRGRRDVAT